MMVADKMSQRLIGPIGLNANRLIGPNRPIGHFSFLTVKTLGP